MLWQWSWWSVVDARSLLLRPSKSAKQCVLRDDLRDHSTKPISASTDGWNKSIAPERLFRGKLHSLMAPTSNNVCLARWKRSTFNDSKLHLVTEVKWSFLWKRNPGLSWLQRRVYCELTDTKMHDHESRKNGSRTVTAGSASGVTFRFMLSTEQCDPMRPSAVSVCDSSGPKNPGFFFAASERKDE